MDLRGSKFIEPSTDEFLVLLGVPLKQQRGGSVQHVPVYIGSVRQRGFGFLSLLKSFGSKVIPFLGKTILPAVAPVLGDFASGVLSDVGKGGLGLKESIKQRGKQAGIQSWENLKSNIQRGGGQKRIQSRKQKGRGKPKRITQALSKKSVVVKKLGTHRKTERKTGSTLRKSLVPKRFARRQDVFAQVL